MSVFDARPIVFTAQSRHLFYARMLICKYVLMQDAIPLNPFNVWGYFLYDMVDRNLVRRGNNNLVRTPDELWVWDPIADGVLVEIEYAMTLGKPLRFFSAGPRFEDIGSIQPRDVELEPDVMSPDHLKRWRQDVQVYCGNLPSAAGRNGHHA